MQVGALETLQNVQLSPESPDVTKQLCVHPLGERKRALHGPKALTDPENARSKTGPSDHICCSLHDYRSPQLFPILAPTM